MVVRLRNAVGVLRSLAAEARGDEAHREQLAEALTTLGTAEFNTANTINSTKAYDEALQLRQDLARERPNDFAAMRQLAEVQGLRARQAAGLGNQADAAALFKSAEDIYRHILKTENNPKDEFQLSR